MGHISITALILCSSTFNATRIALPFTYSEIPPQAMTSCTGAKTRLSFETMQRDIRHVFAMDRRMYQYLRGLVFAIWARMVLSIWQSDFRMLVNCSRNVDDTTQFDVQSPLCSFHRSKLSILGSMGSMESLLKADEDLLHETGETGIEARSSRSPLARISLATMSNPNRLSLNQGIPQTLTRQFPLAKDRGTSQNTLTNPHTTGSHDSHRHIRHEGGNLDKDWRLLFQPLVTQGGGRAAELGLDNRALE